MSTLDRTVRLFEQQGTESDQINKSTYEELAVRTGKVVQQAGLAGTE